MTTGRWKTIAVLVAVFLLGGLAGAGGGRFLAMRELAGTMRGPPAEARARFRVEAMRRHLDLDDAQARELEVIFDEAETEREALMRSCGPGLEELRTRTEARVDAVLRPEQRARHEELERRRPRRPPHGGGRHGPGDHPPPPHPPPHPPEGP